MIWQDFMFAGIYPHYREFLAKVESEAEFVVKSLRNHPCIVLWCGGNELDKNYYRLKTENNNIIGREILADVCRRMDSERPYWPSSPYGGKDPDSERKGDKRANYVYFHKLDIEHYRKVSGKFISEFGFQAPLVLETMNEFYPFKRVEDEFIKKPLSLKWHDQGQSKKTMENILHYLHLYMPAPKSLEQFVEYTQLNQAHALTIMVEHCRRQKFRCGGVLFWQLDDCWPTIGWSIIDYYLRPKIAYYAAKRAFQSVIISLVHNQEEIEVWICNDTLKKVEGTLQVIGMSFKGKTLSAVNKYVAVPPNQSIRVLVITAREMNIQSTSHHPRVVACQCGSFASLAKSSNCSVWCW